MIPMPRLHVSDVFRSSVWIRIRIELLLSILAHMAHHSPFATAPGNSCRCCSDFVRVTTALRISVYVFLCFWISLKCLVNLMFCSCIKSFLKNLTKQFVSVFDELFGVFNYTPLESLCFPVHSEQAPALLFSTNFKCQNTFIRLWVQWISKNRCCNCILHNFLLSKCKVIKNPIHVFFMFFRRLIST